MAFFKDCPCTKDCKDRPNCKGCERGNAWREKKNAMIKRNAAENDFKLYEMNSYYKSMKRAERFKRGKIR